MPDKLSCGFCRGYKNDSWCQGGGYGMSDPECRTCQEKNREMKLSREEAEKQERRERMKKRKSLSYN